MSDNLERSLYIYTYVCIYLYMYVNSIEIPFNHYIIKVATWCGFIAIKIDHT